MVVASQPGSAAGSRILSSWSTRCSQTFWPTSSASASRQPVPAADGPDQRGVPLDQRVPRLLVAVSGAGHQVSDHQVSSHSGRCAGGRGWCVRRAGAVWGICPATATGDLGGSRCAVALCASAVMIWFSCLLELAGKLRAVGWFHRGRRPG